MTKIDKLAVVSGASSGIGAATARRLINEGWTVVGVARRSARLEELKSSLTEGAERFFVEALDASDGAAVQAMARRVLEAHGAPRAVVNSAGAGRWKFIEETSPEEAITMMGAPYFAAFNLTQAFMAAMLEARRGVVIHIGSPASLYSWPGATGYTAARWALRGLHEALTQDLYGTGVSSCHVMFGEVSSEYFVNNPDSHEHIPGIGRIIPVIDPEACGRVVARVIARPRKLVLYPATMWLMHAFGRWMPWLIRLLALRTGRRHAR